MIYFSIVFVVILIDQLTKAWVVSAFQLYEVKEIVSGVFNLVYVTNSGAAFSMLAGVESVWRHYFFFIIGGVATIGLTIAYWKMRHLRTSYTVALALIAGGAIGNLIDRVRFGAVIDFLDLYIGKYHWPAFNVADSAICVGAGLFLVINVLESRKEK